MRLEIDAQFDAALHSPQPLMQLWTMVVALLDQDWTREGLPAQLESFRVTLSVVGRDNDEDAVLEAMDFLVGWCRPHLKV